MSDDLKRSGGFIPGIRPGENTAKQIEFVLVRLTTIGTIYLTFVALDEEKKPTLIPKISPETDKEIYRYNEAKSRFKNRIDRLSLLKKKNNE